MQHFRDGVLAFGSVREEAVPELGEHGGGGLEVRRSAVGLCDGGAEVGEREFGGGGGEGGDDVVEVREGLGAVVG